MAQGDTFNDGAGGSTAGASRDQIDVTAAAGNHVAIHSMYIGGQSMGGGGSKIIAGRDTAAGETFGANHGNASGKEGIGPAQDNKEQTDAVQRKVFIDDTIGLRITFDNENCSSTGRGYQLTGQQVK